LLVADGQIALEDEAVEAGQGAEEAGGMLVQEGFHGVVLYAEVVRVPWKKEPRP